MSASSDPPCNTMLAKVPRPSCFREELQCLHTSVTNQLKGLTALQRTVSMWHISFNCELQLVRQSCSFVHSTLVRLHWQNSRQFDCSRVNDEPLRPTASIDRSNARAFLCHVRRSWEFFMSRDRKRDTHDDATATGINIKLYVTCKKGLAKSTSEYYDTASWLAWL